MRLGKSFPKPLSVILGLCLTQLLSPPASVRADATNLFAAKAQLNAAELTLNGVNFFKIKGTTNVLLGVLDSEAVLGISVSGRVCGSNGTLPDIQLVACDKNVTHIVASLLHFTNLIPIYNDPSQIIIQADGLGGDGMIDADCSTLITFRYDSCTANKNPGQPTSVELQPLGRIRPTGAAPFVGQILPDSGTLTIDSDAPQSPSVIPLSGIGTAPTSNAKLDITPTALNFGTVQVGTNKTLTINLRNNGGVSCVVTSAPSGSAAFTYSPAGLLTIASGADTNISVRFAPWATGSANVPDNATLRLTSSALSLSATNIALTGIGATTLPCNISVTPTHLNFDSPIRTNSLQELNLINHGGETCTVDHVYLVSVSTNFSLSATNHVTALTDAISIPPASTAVVAVVYTPVDTAGATGVVQVDTANDPDNRLVLVNLTATGTIAQCALDIGPSELNFGTVIIGTNRDLTISLTNNTLASCTVSNITLSNTNDFSLIAEPPPFDVPSGTLTNLIFRYTATTTTSATGTVTIAYSDPLINKTISLTGLAVQLSTNCALTVTSTEFTPADPVFNYSYVPVGSTNILKALVSNNSSNTCTFPLFLSGSNAFTTNGLTPGTSVTVPGYGWVEIGVRYVPSSVGTDMGALQIYTNADLTGSVTIGLVGHGVRPSLVVATNTVDFGAVPVDSTATLAVPVANVNRVPCLITNVTIIGSSDFTVDPIVPQGQFILGTNTVVDIPVIYHPRSIGPATAKLFIYSNDPTSPAEVPLKGTGLQSRLVVTPDSLPFGTLALGKSYAQTLTLSNTGNSKLVVNSISLTGSGNFRITVPVLPFTVGAGTNVTLDVSYAPVSGQTITILGGTIRTTGKPVVVKP